MTNWKRIPSVLVVCALWAIAKFSGLDTGIASVAGVAVVLFAFVALAAEFFKSGDIGLGAFGLDTAFSVAQVAVCSANVTMLLARGYSLTIPDILLCVVVVCDAWFSPFNSFRTALRNWASPVGPQ
jgi:hypothetical protein